jgi:hypothetical protein
MLETEIVQKTSHITTEPQTLTINFYDLFIYFFSFNTIVQKYIGNIHTYVLKGDPSDHTVCQWALSNV